MYSLHKSTHQWHRVSIGNAFSEAQSGEEVVDEVGAEEIDTEDNNEREENV